MANLSLNELKLLQKLEPLNAMKECLKINY